MTNEMEFYKNYKLYFKIILALILFYPLAAYANSIKITATKSFPAAVPASSSASAIFIVTNTSSHTEVIVTNKSHFPLSCGLSISSTTCGKLLKPGQSCEINVQLQARMPGQVISGTIIALAAPTFDVAEYPIHVSVTGSLPAVTLKPIPNGGLPALRGPIVAVDSDNWLILSGSLGSFHNFTNMFNQYIYVYNPNTMQLSSVALNKTQLPDVVKEQLNSSDQEFLQDGDTLYIIGGFYNPPHTSDYKTLDTITAINVPGMIQAVLNQKPVHPFVSFKKDFEEFKSTGGQLGKIDNYFYLAFGQICEGQYCAFSQTYKNSIYQFTTDPTLSSINIINKITHQDSDGSGWRRRDYTLVPFKVRNKEVLFALGGPFAPGDNAMVWTNGIIFNADLQYNDNFINQQANQYLTSNLSMYSSHSNTSYVATFAGLSNLYWATTGLVYDNTTPLGNILDLISADASGKVSEFVNLQPVCSGQPLASCLYTGVGSQFIPVAEPYDERGILQLDQLPPYSPTLVGYIYGGLLTSSLQTLFGNDAVYVTNQVYAVYVTPFAFNSVNWLNVTHSFTGNPSAAVK